LPVLPPSPESRLFGRDTKIVLKAIMLRFDVTKTLLGNRQLLLNETPKKE
jgi:hypothetical protein